VSVPTELRTTLIVVALLVGLLGVIAAILLFLAPRSPDALPGVTPTEDDDAPSWAPPADPPLASATPGNGIATLADAGWVSETAAATGIPERALAAYAGAAIAKAQMMPECGISWNTIAGIGATESGHGQHGGSAVGPDGTVTPPIYGVPLAGGEGVEYIADSDGGAIDGDAEFDRAVGPFQLIPQTWRNWHVDGSGDGVEDPQNIDDAAMATVNYLCRSSTAIDTEAGWRAAISAFNSPSSYLDTVAGYAVQYAEAAD
jgi:membrane-bound lytic murein transglycosylase B